MNSAMLFSPTQKRLADFGIAEQRLGRAGEAVAPRRQHIAAMGDGQRQMVAVGRALMAEPKLLMLDEPTAGLSPLVMEQIFERIVAVNRAGIGILLVEQNARQALAIAHRGYVLATGRNRFTGTAEALLGNPDIGQSFLGG